MESQPMESLPYVPGSDTSEAAAESMRGGAAAIVRQRVLDHIVKCGEAGATCDEVERQLVLTHQTASARVHELMRQGVIFDSGVRRATRSGRKATVWRWRTGQLVLPTPSPERAAKAASATPAAAPALSPDAESLRAALAPFADLLSPSTPQTPMVAVMVRRSDLEAAKRAFSGEERSA